MTVEKKHIVNKQVFEVRLNSSRNAHEIQDKISDTWHDQILPLLDDVFSEMVPANELLRIDKLELDIGRIRKNRIAEDLPVLVRRQLEDALSRYAYQRDGVTPSGGAAVPVRGNDQGGAQAGNAQDVFIHFLKYGSLPWWAGRDEFTSMRKLGQYLSEKMPSVLVAAARQHIDDERFIKRLIFQLSEKQIMQLVKAEDLRLFNITDRINSYLYALYKEGFFGYTKESFMNKVLQGALQYVLSGTAVANTAFTAARKIANTWESEYFCLQVDALSYESGTPDYAGNTLTGVLRATENSRLALTDITFRKFIRRLCEKNTAVDLWPVSKRTPVNFPASPDMASEQIAGSYIHNAGAVILWPFLAHLFRGVELCGNEGFISKDAACRACMLIEFMVKGKEDFQEQEMQLNKLLCGLEPAEPLDVGIILTDNEKDECRNLLEHICTQWVALRGISVEGLQLSFLQKEGILTAEGKGRVLKIQRSAIDILIDKLPWGISLIKLPWNRELIYVEW